MSGLTHPMSGQTLVCLGLQGDCQHSVMYILPYTPLINFDVAILPTTHEQLVHGMQFARGRRPN